MRKRGSATASITRAYHANNPSSDTSLKKNGGSTRQPAQPDCTLSRVSAMVSVSAAQPVAATMRSAGMPAASSAASPSARSAIENDWPSPVVPNGATPSTPCASSHCACRAKRRVIDAAVAADRRQHRAPEAVDGVNVGVGLVMRFQ